MLQPFILDFGCGPSPGLNPLWQWIWKGFLSYFVLSDVLSIFIRNSWNWRGKKSLLFCVHFCIHFLLNLVLSIHERNVVFTLGNDSNLVCKLHSIHVVDQDRYMYFISTLLRGDSSKRQRKGKRKVCKAGIWKSARSSASQHANLNLCCN